MTGHGMRLNGLTAKSSSTTMAPFSIWANSDTWCYNLIQIENILQVVSDLLKPIIIVLAGTGIQNHLCGVRHVF
jgi:hypothetical protein